jgi:hypothetical protein
MILTYDQLGHGERLAFLEAQNGKRNEVVASMSLQRRLLRLERERHRGGKRCCLCADRSAAVKVATCQILISDNGRGNYRGRRLKHRPTRTPCRACGWQSRVVEVS